ncbi:hypothetical protein [Gordonia jinghuaiqii]|uniref:hypothetical protein n=1 Tax=Gordonia jinghuaiqii TaxID=2758710 RepID=UPI002948BD90|nr:hypothetical protein [Gordonia jinghuaiqii]
MSAQTLALIAALFEHPSHWWCRPSSVHWYSAASAPVPSSRPLQAVILSDTTESTVSTATGTIPTVQQIGASLGLAIVTIFFFGQVAGHTSTSVPEIRAVLAVTLRNSSVDPLLREVVADRFAWCAQAQLRSPHPERPHARCSPSGPVAAWTQDAARAVTARTFLSALQTTLGALAAVTAAIAVTALLLGRDRQRTNRPASLRRRGDSAFRSDQA